MPLHLLDTNIISDAIRNGKGACARRIAQSDASTLCTSIIVAAELRFGAAKKGASTLSTRIEAALASIPVLPLDGNADRFYAQIRAELERAGKLIGGNDMLIAAHVLSLEAVLITDNVAEFSRVPGLRVENWLARG